MQIVSKIYIELQEMIDNNKIKTGHFWWQGNKYNIIDGKIVLNNSISTVTNTDIGEKL